MHLAAWPRSAEPRIRLRPRPSRIPLRSSGQGCDWNAEPLHLLIDHIVATYHDSLRQELPRLESMAAKVARTHGLSAAHLARLEAIVSELSAELRSHMRKEELVLFLAIRTNEEGGAHPG